MNEDEQIKLAIQLSMENQPAPVPSTSLGRQTQRKSNGSFMSKIFRKSKGGDSNENGTGSKAVTNGSGKNGKNTKLYAARRSLRAKKMTSSAGDGDVWTEAFAISETDIYEQLNDADENVSITPTVRSYFESQNTRKREWDEPPTGASSVIFAPDSARKMAEAQAAAYVEEIMTGDVAPRMTALTNESSPSASVDSNVCDINNDTISAKNDVKKKTSKSLSEEEDLATAIALSLSVQQIQDNFQESACDMEHITLLEEKDILEGNDLSQLMDDDRKLSAKPLPTSAPR